MDIVEDTYKLFEKYLEDDENIEYITQNQIFPKDDKISFIIWIAFCCCFLLYMYFSTARIFEIICVLLVILGISYFIYFYLFFNHKKSLFVFCCSILLHNK